jgi:hypothetical protein
MYLRRLLHSVPASSRISYVVTLSWQGHISTDDRRASGSSAVSAFSAVNRVKKLKNPSQNSKTVLRSDAGHGYHGCDFGLPIAE